jgi:hypothetical protein
MQSSVSCTSVALCCYSYWLSDSATAFAAFARSCSPCFLSQVPCVLPRAEAFAPSIRLPSHTHLSFIDIYGVLFTDRLPQLPCFPTAPFRVSLFCRRRASWCYWWSAALSRYMHGGVQRLLALRQQVVWLRSGFDWWIVYR